MGYHLMWSSILDSFPEHCHLYVLSVCSPKSSFFSLSTGNSVLSVHIKRWPQSAILKHPYSSFTLTWNSSLRIPNFLELHLPPFSHLLEAPPSVCSPTYNSTLSLPFYLELNPKITHQPETLLSVCPHLALYPKFAHLPGTLPSVSRPQCFLSFSLPNYRTSKLSLPSYLEFHPQVCPHL